MSLDEPNQTTEKMSRLAMLWGKALPSVSAFVRSVIHNPHDADDVIQATVSYIAANMDDYDPSTPFVAWAIGISRYRILELRHQNSRQPALLGDEALASFSDAMVEESEYLEDRLAALEHCIGLLSEQHRRVLANRYFDQHSHKHIAQAMGLRENTVSVILHRVRQALHDCIDSRLGGAS